MRITHTSIRFGARLWPGACSLWEGSIGGLICSIAFALLFNAALLTTWWPSVPAGSSVGEFPASSENPLFSIPTILWGSVLVWSVFSFWRTSGPRNGSFSRGGTPVSAANGPEFGSSGVQGSGPESGLEETGEEMGGDAAAAEATALLKAAQQEYLKGHWFEAEQMLARQRKLPSRGQDLAALLLWAAVLGRTGRIDEAEKMLEQAPQSRGAERWSWDIQRERERLDRMRSDNFAKSSHSPDVTEASARPRGGQEASPAPEDRRGRAAA